MADGAPPENRERALWLTPGDVHVLDVVLLGGVALNRSGIQPVLHGSGEGRARHDRLPDHALPVSYDLTVLTQSRRDPVIVHGPVAATHDVVLTGPDEPHGILPANSLRD